MVVGGSGHLIPYSLILEENLRYMSQRVQASAVHSNDKVYEALLTKNATYANYFAETTTKRLSVFERLVASSEEEDLT